MSVAPDFIALLPHFLEETAPLIDALGPAFAPLALVWARGERDPGEPHILSDLHTIKGNAAMMGVAPIEAVAGALADLLAMPGLGSAAGGALLERGGELLAALARGYRSGELDAAEVSGFVAAVGAHRGDSRDTPIGRPLRLSPVGAAADSIRVDFRRLDALSSLVAEATEAAARGAIAEVAVVLDRLQAALIEARLTPLSTLFDRFGRHVRELARLIGQPIRLVVAGGDAAVDKAIVDRLGEPLVHVVRNAAAHGIEPVAERIRAGKPAEATISLGAECGRGRLIVTVEDDGRGIDLAAVRERATRLGREVAGLDDAASLRLIFMPRLTTAPSPSSLAGRGVGLDVVASSVAAMGGSIDVESTPGRGTRFRLDLPLNLGRAREMS